MQQIVFDKPYQFIPPHPGRFWPSVFRPLLPMYLKRFYGVGEVQFRGQELLKASLDAGHGILVAANHCRDCDPLVVASLCRVVPSFFYLMASWHLFMQSRLLAWIVPRGGAFSIYREGMDRAAISMATEILEQARRPLIIFPEGVVSRTNDRLNPLMEGVTLIARTAAKKRAKLSPAGKVVVHPVGLRYHFRGDINAAAGGVLDDIETRLSWRPQRELSLVDRIAKVGMALLCLKEIEYFGRPQTGSIAERLQGLIDRLLVPLEAEWLDGQREASVVARVKRLRIAILPDMVKGEITEAERQRRWRQLADAYLAQQLAQYPPDYLRDNPSPERLLEIVERFEEDLTDTVRIHPWITATVTVGPAIEVGPAREQRNGEDPLLQKIEAGMRHALGIAELQAAAV